MVILFQIRINYVDIHGPLPTPTVFLDTEESSVAVLSDMKTGDEDPRLRLAREMHMAHLPGTTSISALHPSYVQSVSPTHSSVDQKTEFLPILNLPWSFSDDLSPSQHVCRVYPLKISLHEALRSLQLIEDGSRLFRRASFETLFCTPAFSETQPLVEFKVEVIGATGKIVQATCLRELTDKRLQGLAQSLIKHLRFCPFTESKEKTISGILAIQFAGTFDMISNLLETEELS